MAQFVGVFNQTKLNAFTKNIKVFVQSLYNTAIFAVVESNNDTFTVIRAELFAVVMFPAVEETLQFTMHQVCSSR